MKASSSTGGIKNLLLQHVEKIVLGVAVILVGLFLWSALGVKPIDASKSPTTLETAANEEVARIARNDTQPPPPPTLNFVGGVAAGLEPVQLATYSLPQRLNPPIQPPIVKRPDPKLLPVENPIATAVIISVPEEGLAPTWKDEDEEKEKAKKAAKKKTEPRPNIDGARGRRRARGAPGYGAPGYGQADQPGYGDTGQSGYGKTAARGRGGHGGTGYGTTQQSQPGYGQTGRGGSSAADRSSSGQTGYGAVGPSRGGAGYGAVGGYGGAGVPGGKPGVVVQSVEAKGTIRPAVVLTGRVPYSKQFDEFVNKFKEAIQPEAHDTQRDLPVYNQFKIERQEITGAGDEKWVVLDLDQAVKDERWAVTPEPDQVDPSYLDQVLAWPMPPTIGRNWGRLASHPSIPFAWMFDESQQRGFTGGGYGADAPGIESRRRNTAMDGGGGYGATGGGYGRTGYGTTGYGGTGHGRTGYGTASDGGRVRAGAGVGATADVTGFTEPPLTAHVPSYLFRFVDTQKVEAGKQYRYRITLELANPNFGLPPTILADPASSNKETLLTPPAETATVKVPHDRTLYALAAKTNNKSLVDYEGQVLYHVWNPKMGVEMAKEFDLKLGEIAEFIDTVENWYNPYTGLAEKLEGVPFQYVDGKPTAAPMLADITGGEKLPGAKSTDEPQPAEMLFIDANGRMFTANEARDAAALDFYKERYVEQPAPEANEGLYAPEQPTRGAAPAGAYSGAR
jgi:hypothetical protein